MFYVWLTSVPSNVACSHFEHQFEEDYVEAGFANETTAKQMLIYYMIEYAATGYVWERQES